MFFKAQKDDIVDIILPATGCSENEVLSIKNYVKNNLGLTPRILLENEVIFTTDSPENEFPINDKNQRFSQLKAALQSDDSSIIWCARGGYGSGDLLPLLEKMDPIKQNKLFIGFSDIVSISTFLQDKWGWNIICAPVLVQLARNEIDKKSENELKELIFGKKSEFNYDLEILNHSYLESKITTQVFAKICGGCLSVLAGHLGTNQQINFQDKILFLEDEGEDGERLDRYFRQIVDVVLKNQERPKAILLGNFLQGNIHGEPKAKNIQIAINNFIQRLEDSNLQIPLFATKDNNIGHSNKMRPLILGYEARIIEENEQYKLSLGL
jgi:muramoyltetrapeptide carboxypeptidase